MLERQGGDVQESPRDEWEPVCVPKSPVWWGSHAHWQDRAEGQAGAQRIQVYGEAGEMWPELKAQRDREPERLRLGA